MGALILFLTLLSVEGAQTNEELENHKGDLTAHIIKIERYKTATAAADRTAGLPGSPYRGSTTNINNSVRQLNKSPSMIEDDVINKRKECLETCRDALTYYNALKPFTVIGIKASYGITTTILSLAITFFSVVYSAYKAVGIA